MKIYLVVRTDAFIYDEYDSAVVVAETPAEAVNLLKTLHTGEYGGWGSFKVKVTEIVADKARIVLESFNAG